MYRLLAVSSESKIEYLFLLVGLVNVDKMKFYSFPGEEKRRRKFTRWIFSRHAFFDIQSAPQKKKRKKENGLQFFIRTWRSSRLTNYYYEFPLKHSWVLVKKKSFTLIWIIDFTHRLQKNLGVWAGSLAWESSRAFTCFVTSAPVFMTCPGVYHANFLLIDIDAVSRWNIIDIHILSVPEKVIVFCYYGMSVGPYVLPRHHQ